MKIEHSPATGSKLKHFTLRPTQGGLKYAESDLLAFPFNSMAVAQLAHDP